MTRLSYFNSSAKYWKMPLFLKRHPEYVSTDGRNEDGSTRYTQSAFHQQLCQYLESLTGIAPRIVPHGEGDAVILD